MNRRNNIIKKNKMSGVSRFILRFFMNKDDSEQRASDFNEVYEYLAESSGRRKAVTWYSAQLIKSIPSLFLNSFYWGMSMLLNYIKIGLRNIKLNKGYTFIIITGMAVSFAACFLVLNYAGFELSYDTFHEDADNIYRLTNDRYQKGELIQHGVITYPSVVKSMRDDYSEVLNYTRITYWDRMFVRLDNKGFDEQILFADSAFFNMFTFPLIVGDAETSLAAPYSILLSETLANKYFGSNWREKDVTGAVLNIDNSYDVILTGIFKDVPHNSHMKFDIVASYATLGKQYNTAIEDSWTNSNYMGYLQLLPGTDHKKVEKKFDDFSNKYFKGDEVTGYEEKFYLQSLTEIHLHSDYEYDPWVHGSNTAVIGLLIIAAFILFIAWFNYININTARSIERAKEVGVRKVVGAEKGQVIKQFLVESVLFITIGTLIAAAAVMLLRPVFSELLNVNFSSTIFSNEIGIAYLILFLSGTFISVGYPAMIISSFNSISVLTGKFKQSAKGRVIRKGLVAFQFVLSFILISGTYAVYSQIDYMLEEDLGMNIDQIMVVGGPVLTRWDSVYFNNIGSFKSELMANPNIIKATASRRLPGRGTGKIFNIERLSGNSSRKYTTADIGIDHDFFDTFEIKLIAGRAFEPDDYNVNFQEVQSVIINLAASELLGFSAPEQSYNQRIKFWGREWEIIGVVSNHHHQSLHVPMEPVIFTPLYSTSNYFFIKVNPQNVNKTISAVENTYNEFFPGNSFTYFFLDDYFNEQYQNDQNFRAAFSLFASLGVMLACLGLFGLSFYTISQRTKEIGIRKVVGASTNNILIILVKDFARLILIASIIASPITYYAINAWLSDYAYRIEIGFNMLIIPGIAVFLIALLTISYQTIKAANTNPVESLKYE
jgi:putative ABC transport system permease protein